MATNDSQVCQCHCVPNLSLGTIHDSTPSLRKWVKLALKRSLNASTKRNIKKITNNLFEGQPNSNRRKAPNIEIATSTTSALAPGDIVRVRSFEEIQATLNIWNELKGCMFMEAQRQYCGTTQRVLKTVERFVDERDYHVKKAKGLVLLEGLICEGSADYGRCDRACFYFWRQEWLEKIDTL